MPKKAKFAMKKRPGRPAKAQPAAQLPTPCQNASLGCERRFRSPGIMRNHLKYCRVPAPMAAAQATVPEVPPDFPPALYCDQNLTGMFHTIGEVPGDRLAVYTLSLVVVKESPRE